jgi:hypothetical protein
MNRVRGIVSLCTAGVVNRAHAILSLCGTAVCLCCLAFVPKAQAETRGCYDNTVRCTNWFYGQGTCGYNATRNGCTCAGSVKWLSLSWSVGDSNCKSNPSI